MVDALQILDRASIQKMSESHEIHDDEMVGIRRLTKDYYLSADASMGVRVLFHELMNFEKELIQHARIEDRLLFPKAIELEKEALKKLKKLIQKKRIKIRLPNLQYWTRHRHNVCYFQFKQKKK